jgi:UDP-N-acetylmuramoyl-tripeptide--D-alanyl-D-alanine ligase
MGKSKKVKFLETILRLLATSVLRRHKPKVVAITGSVGKTTTKDMTWKLLEKHFNVRRNIKNYNNEIGVPLTIIGAESGEKSFLKWCLVFLKWIDAMLSRNYPEILVLEMGADKPGDIKYLTSFVPVDVGVITNIGISHLENFKTKKSVAIEKGYLLKSVPVNGLAILNSDDEECRKIASGLKTNVIKCGFDDGATMLGSDIVYGYRSLETKNGKKIKLIKGILFKLSYQGKIIPIKLKHALGYPQVYAAINAFAVGEYFKLNKFEAAEALQEFIPPPGRMVLMPGIKNSALIDDTYNSAPDSVDACIKTLEKIEAERKIVVLGDMLELGDEEESAHREIGKKIAKLAPDFFVAVGTRMKYAADEYRKNTKNKDSIGCFNSPIEAMIFVQHILKEGDVVLIKGSQGMRMEKIVEEIMRQPDKKKKLLVRQDDAWQKKEFVSP